MMGATLDAFKRGRVEDSRDLVNSAVGKNYYYTHIHTEQRARLSV